MESYNYPPMKPMPLWKEVYAAVTLGLLVGWYFVLILCICPSLLYFSLYSTTSGGPLLLNTCRVGIAILVILTVSPLDPSKEWEGFMYGFTFKTWCEYFEFSKDVTSLAAKRPGKKHLYFEFPHGIFPMGQFMSVTTIREISPNNMIYGLAADVIFKVPVIRQIMTWVGTWPATRKNITKIFAKGGHVGIQVGGIAEIFLMNTATESIFLKKRKGSVKAAIQEGADIIPVFFFGNTRLFHCPANNEGSFLSKLSRKLKMSIVFFYGRFGLTIPFRHPIKMVSGTIIQVEQNDDPDDKLIDATMDKVIESIEKLYKEKKPDWETRPLVIS